MANNNIVIIPEELHAKTYLAQGLDTDTLIVMVAMVGVAGALIQFNVVHDSLELFFVIYNVLVGYLLCRPSKHNPKRKTYHAILFLFKRRHTGFIPVCPPNSPRQENLLADHNWEEHG